MKFSKLMVLVITCVSLNITQAQNDKAGKQQNFSPEYHFYPSGDPTGLFYYDGYYYNNWGYAKSKDFVHWEFTELGKKNNEIQKKLNNSETSEKEKDSLRKILTRLGGSGTVIIDQQNNSGLATGENPPLLSFWHNQIEPWNNQVVGLAYSNDTVRSWKRYEKFPILDINSREFRDPKVFWHEETQKWIMAINWADAAKVRFYSSENLTDWEFLSDFGPWGAVNGVWECVDLFELPIDGDENNKKWVMVISVQPLSAQYFIGDFDGEQFKLDPEFQQELPKTTYLPDGVVLFDFETGIDNWEIEGEAFLKSPANGALYKQSAVMGFQGKYFINSFNKQAKATGKITSPGFTIKKDHINFLIGGGYYPQKESINLIVDGKRVRDQSGNHSGGLQWKSWKVGEFKGKEAKIEIVDQMSDKAGYIYVDHIMMSDEPAKTNWQDAFWVDYGPDFYAVRAWNNYSKNEDRIVWTGWMSSWRYTFDEPLSRMQSIPRNVALKTFPEGIRLVQTPIQELKSLRAEHKKIKNKKFNGTWTSKNFIPSKNSYELIVEFDAKNAGEVGVKLAKGNKEETIIGYSVNEEELFVDRRKSGRDSFSGLFAKKSTGPMKNRGLIKFHIFIDKTSVEVFGNNGETVISSKIYPNDKSTGIQFYSKSGNAEIKNAQLYELNSIGLYQNK